MKSQFGHFKSEPYTMKYYLVGKKEENLTLRSSMYGDYYAK